MKSTLILIVTVAAACAVSVGQWGPPVCTTLGVNGVTGPTAVDLDGDGIDEIVVVATASVHVLARGATAYYLAATINVSPFLTMFLSRALVGDIDGDGTSEIVATGQSSSAVFTIDFVGQTPVVTTFLLPAAAGLADMDGDGDLDLVFRDGQVGHNDGTGSFGAATMLLPPLGAAFVQLTEDFDLDGDPDILVREPIAFASSGTTVFTLWRNDGAGNMTLGWQSAPAIGIGPTFVVTGDFNGDLFPDVALSNNAASNLVAVMLNDGAGGFVASSVATLPAASPFAEPMPTGLAVVDFNGDGIDDLFHLASTFTLGGFQTFTDRFRGTPGGLVPVGGTLQNGISQGNAVAGSFDNAAGEDIAYFSSAGLVGATDVCVRSNLGAVASAQRQVSIVSGDLQATNVGEALPAPLAVQVTQLGTGNVVAGAPVTFTGPDLPTTLATTDAAGMAQLSSAVAPISGGPFTISARTPLGSAPATFSLFARALDVAWAPVPGDLTITFANDNPVPIILAMDTPLAAPIVTLFGTVHTSVLAPGPDLVLLDGTGILAPPNPYLMATPTFQVTIPLGPALSGLTRVFQVYAIDSSLAFPLNLITSNPQTVMF